MHGSCVVHPRLLLAGERACLLALGLLQQAEPGRVQWSKRVVLQVWIAGGCCAVEAGHGGKMGKSGRRPSCEVAGRGRRRHSWAGAGAKTKLPTLTPASNWPPHPPTTLGSSPPPHSRLASVGVAVNSLASAHSSPQRSSSSAYLASTQRRRRAQHPVTAGCCHFSAAALRRPAGTHQGRGRAMPAAVHSSTPPPQRATQDLPGRGPAPPPPPPRAGAPAPHPTPPAVPAHPPAGPGQAVVVQVPARHRAARQRRRPHH